MAIHGLVLWRWFSMEQHVFQSSVYHHHKEPMKTIVFHSLSVWSWICLFHDVAIMMVTGDPRYSWLLWLCCETRFQNMVFLSLRHFTLMCLSLSCQINFWMIEQLNRPLWDFYQCYIISWEGHYCFSTSLWGCGGGGLHWVVWTPKYGGGYLASLFLIFNLHFMFTF